MFTKVSLDKPLYDVVIGSFSTETVREFIRQSEDQFGIEPQDIDSFDDYELTDYVNELDILWNK